jgi:hypothetical protein
MIKNSYMIEGRGRKKEMCGENNMSSLIWKCYAGMQNWWWFNMIQSCWITFQFFHTKLSNLYARVHYGAISTYNYSSKLYPKLTVKSMRSTTNERGSCCVLGSLEKHATMDIFPWHNNLCLLVLSFTRRRFRLSVM